MITSAIVQKFFW
jgi:transposase InsO family protein